MQHATALKPLKSATPYRSLFYPAEVVFYPIAGLSNQNPLLTHPHPNPSPRPRGPDPDKEPDDWLFLHNPAHQHLNI